MDGSASQCRSIIFVFHLWSKLMSMVMFSSKYISSHRFLMCKSFNWSFIWKIWLHLELFHVQYRHEYIAEENILKIHIDNTLRQVDTSHSLEVTLHTIKFVMQSRTTHNLRWSTANISLSLIRTQVHTPEFELWIGDWTSEMTVNQDWHLLDTILATHKHTMQYALTCMVGFRLVSSNRFWNASMAFRICPKANDRREANKCWKLRSENAPRERIWKLSETLIENCGIEHCRS